MLIALSPTCWRLYVSSCHFIALLYIVSQVFILSPDNAHLSQINTIKCEIEEIYNKKAIGCIIHSRCKFIDEYVKPSKYFLNLEKVVQKVKQIRCLVVGGKRIFNPTEIQKTESKFYAKLYFVDSDSMLDNLDYDRHLTDINIPIIGIECDGEIRKEEICKAVQDLPNNKSPGPDGIPIEFYKKFWSSISEILFDSYRKSFESGQLSPSQKKCVITLIPKKDKDLTELKSCRPLS